MGKWEKEPYIQVFAWMVDIYDLAGKELLVFATVYNLVECTLEEIMKFTGLTDKETFATLQRLKEYKPQMTDEGLEYTPLVDRYKKDKKAYYFVNEEVLF